MSGSAPSTAARLKVVLDCSMSVKRQGLIQAKAALEAAERIAPVEVYAFPLRGRGGIVRRLGPPRPWTVEEACRLADHRLGTPLARAVYEAAHRVYRPGDRFRALLVTDGECTHCGSWLRLLEKDRSWVWRTLIVLTRPPEWLEKSKYREGSLALLRLINEASKPWPPPLASLGEVVEMHPRDPRLRPTLPPEPNPSPQESWKTGFP